MRKKTRVIQEAVDAILAGDTQLAQDTRALTNFISEVKGALEDKKLEMQRDLDLIFNQIFTQFDLMAQRLSRIEDELSGGTAVEPEEETHDNVATLPHRK